MDFKTKNFKERTHNYNSMAEFTKPFPLPYYNEDRTYHLKSKEPSLEMSPLPFLRNNK